MDRFAGMLHYLNRFADSCTGGSGGSVTVPSGKDGQCSTFQTGLPTTAANTDTLKLIIQLGFGIIGSIAIVYIMYAAFRFVRSQGDPQQVAQARMTIIYALIGLAIALSAELIVTYAIGRV